MAASRPDVERPKKRAIALAGGGPAMGFHIGALAALEGAGIEFHVWSLSCIGAWVGVYYNQLRGAGRAARTHQFFREHAFRDAQSYRGFPVNRAFAPNLQAFARAWRDHLSSPRSWQDMWPQGREWQEAADGWARFLWSPEAWQRDGDLNLHVLNNVLAVHPVSRMLTSLIYSSGINGLSNLYYRDSSLLEVIDFGGLDISGRNHDHTSREALDALVRDAGGGGRPGSDPAPAHAVPEIYHNAWRLPDDGPQRDGDRGELRVFNNRWLHYRRRRPPREYLPITPSSLCACSALPYIEQTVPIAGDGGRHHSEGALVDTVNFHHLVEDHPDLDEIWVCRIVDDHQVRRPRQPARQPGQPVPAVRRRGRRERHQAVQEPPAQGHGARAPAGRDPARTGHLDQLPLGPRQPGPGGPGRPVRRRQGAGAAPAADAGDDPCAPLALTAAGRRRGVSGPRTPRPQGSRGVPPGRRPRARSARVRSRAGQPAPVHARPTGARQRAARPAAGPAPTSRR
jgi:predicted acylesterase/phospholipase RssA